MANVKEYLVEYWGDYKNGGARAKYFDYLEDAFDLYAGACKRAMKNKIKANKMIVRRSSDGLIFAWCEVWFPPVTHEQVLYEHCDARACHYRVASIKGEIADCKARIAELEKEL